MPAASRSRGLGPAPPRGSAGRGRGRASPARACVPPVAMLAGIEALYIPTIDPRSSIVARRIDIGDSPCYEERGHLVSSWLRGDLRAVAPDLGFRTGRQGTGGVAGPEAARGLPRATPPRPGDRPAGGRYVRGALPLAIGRCVWPPALWPFPRRSFAFGE